ncbi:hypothetical protein PGUG_02929 [Meyerozyma guilliermondii ATCC 6260]|uniref:Mitochondrial thiamine pyrophosphate carrier 1 n=1 Tax=Meyerozyma guilliermondii (strain ATCC 6260 / CBS 566 / DSM 6381 / JCM 1539 / NBRC 10279 / NRRL Y-324) TaxID=294746 RepID=A5DI28_PICGU|nr:uncharacterized protein PGUG_02929 [Meyerozyma guilliermondii ATCC 6260]EDK38831.2 hypothetical protein PGUG_02929 [Meyerozyma guilliermondii ATCC 6260]
MKNMSKKEILNNSFFPLRKYSKLKPGYSLLPSPFTFLSFYFSLLFNSSLSPRPIHPTPAELPRGSGIGRGFKKIPSGYIFTFFTEKSPMATISPDTEIKKKPVNFSNILLGAGLNMAEATTLGQPLEVVKTTMAANRNLSIVQATKLVMSRGGLLGFYQGLIPWAWIEASTKGAVLLFVSAEAEYHYKKLGASNFISGMGGGVTGGLAQAYLTMGFCTCMKTVEITRSKQAAVSGVPQQTAFQVFKEIWRKEGIRGINKGVNAVAIRQMTNWGSRFGLSRLAEEAIRSLTGKGETEKMSAVEKIGASVIGGGLSAWNQPIEVIRVEMQSKTTDPNRPKNLGVASAFSYIYKNNGLKGLYRGVTPRVALGVWQTVFMVAFGDIFKRWLNAEGAGH